MKHLLIAVFFLLMTGVSYATTWFPTNQITLSWDQVTTLDDGSPVPEGSTIQYEVWYKNEDTGVNTLVGETADTQQVVAFTSEGKYRLGVRSIRMDGAQKVSFSAIAWSSDPVNCQSGEDFGVSYYLVPAQAGGLRTE